MQSYNLWVLFVDFILVTISQISTMIVVGELSIIKSYFFINANIQIVSDLQTLFNFFNFCRWFFFLPSSISPLVCSIPDHGAIHYDRHLRSS